MKIKNKLGKSDNSKMQFKVELLINDKMSKDNNKVAQDLMIQSKNQIDLIKLYNLILKSTSASLTEQMDLLKAEASNFTNFYFDYNKELSHYKKNVDLKEELAKIHFKSLSTQNQEIIKKAVYDRFNKVQIAQAQPENNKIESSKEFSVLFSEPDEEDQTENINHVNLEYYSSFKDSNNIQSNCIQERIESNISKESIYYFKMSVNEGNLDNYICCKYIESANYNIDQAIRNYIESKNNTTKIKINLRTASKNYLVELGIFDKIDEIFNVIYNTFQMYSIEVYIEKSKEDIHNLMTRGVVYIGGLKLVNGDRKSVV